MFRGVGALWNMDMDYNNIDDDDEDVCVLTNPCKASLASQTIQIIVAADDVFRD